MNGKYLGTDLEALKEIGEGKVFEYLNNFVNEANQNRNKTARLAAYEIRNDYSSIAEIYCVFESENGLSFRSFAFYQSGKIEDELKSSAEYGFGLHEVDMKRFLKLHEFYQQSLKAV